MQTTFLRTSWSPHQLCLFSHLYLSHRYIKPAEGIPGNRMRSGSDGQSMEWKASPGEEEIKDGPKQSKQLH